MTGEEDYVPGAPVQVAPAARDEGLDQGWPRELRARTVVVGSMLAVLGVAVVCLMATRGHKAPVAAPVAPVAAAVTQPVVTASGAPPATSTVTATTTARVTATATRVRRVMVPGPERTRTVVEQTTVVQVPPAVTVRITATRTVRVTVTRRVSRSTVRAALDCAPIRPVDVSLVGGLQVTTQVRAVRCGQVVWIDRLLSASTSPYRVAAVEVYRVGSDGVHGVRSAVVPGDAASAGHGIDVYRSIPAARFGYSGWVRVTLLARGERRAVILHI